MSRIKNKRSFLLLDEQSSRINPKLWTFAAFMNIDALCLLAR